MAGSRRAPVGAAGVAADTRRKGDNQRRGMLNAPSERSGVSPPNPCHGGASSRRSTADDLLHRPMSGLESTTISSVEAAAEATDAEVDEDASAFALLREVPGVLEAIERFSKSWGLEQKWSFSLVATSPAGAKCRTLAQLKARACQERGNSPVRRACSAVAASNPTRRRLSGKASTPMENSPLARSLPSPRPSLAATPGKFAASFARRRLSVKGPEASAAAVSPQAVRGGRFSPPVAAAEKRRPAAPARGRKRPASRSAAAAEEEVPGPKDAASKARGGKRAKNLDKKAIAGPAVDPAGKPESVSTVATAARSRATPGAAGVAASAEAGARAAAPAAAADATPSKEPAGLGSISSTWRPPSFDDDDDDLNIGSAWRQTACVSRASIEAARKRALAGAMADFEASAASGHAAGGSRSRLAAARLLARTGGRL
eukprot:TRINITY_DN19953_c0_g5_i1.p1 TRINITY_DN19953_c0_g5~~TRINITY_DN19953_c0_g5_i1.p1  ORF type:complete len:460 (+),score=92.06 TRINITY_DN19953_c0_g5_i1:88-1380(+)